MTNPENDEPKSNGNAGVENGSGSLHGKPHDEKDSAASIGEGSEIDLLSYHEHQAGRLIIDPAEARIELGDAIASRLKLTQDGTTVLWPQPTDSPRDPQNWSSRRKHIQLAIITLAAIVPDFDSGIGIASIFALANQFNTSTGHINNLTSNWSIFLLGWGGLFAVMLMRRYGRLPVLFWSQVLALGWLVGCTFAPNLNTFTAMRCLNGFFATAPQVTGLYVITDIFPFHLQARKLNVWTMGFIISPFLSPFAFGFLVARTTWRWAYGIGSIYSALVVLIIIFFGEETMYDRTVKPVPEPQTTGLRYRIETLVGITGAKMAKFRPSWKVAILAPFKVVWRPHLVMILLFEAMVFGFSIGINVTNAVFLGTPPPVGYGFSQFAIAGAYATPIVSVIIGEIVGRYVNDYIQNTSIRRNKGVHEAESRLWACYIAMPLYICGFVVLGAALQNHLTVGALIMGWGIAELAVMINTVAVYAYCNDCFPKQQVSSGEISALVNLARTLGGFSVAYFQVPWATEHGAIQTFGVESAIVVGLFLLVVPALQLKGRSLRAAYSL
ncbi:MFS general substrate transporter [Pluteus cervinus]|uniref:MFS general substrate transporter n=1 Tax=Pluteus cervinus TaxID=181527 RepID=A0ACD3AN47_9AGAR|nr:MFS general substrate transporter [Pluteus cervinus]